MPEITTEVTIDVEISEVMDTIECSNCGSSLDWSDEGYGYIKVDRCTCMDDYYYDDGKDEGYAEGLEEGRDESQLNIQQFKTIEEGDK